MSTRSVWPPETMRQRTGKRGGGASSPDGAVASQAAEMWASRRLTASRGVSRRGAAGGGVQRDRGGDGAGEPPAAVADDGSCGLVAGGLDAEDVQAAGSV